MESNHLYLTFRALLATVIFAIIIGSGLAVFGKLNEALVVLLTNVTTGCFTLLNAPRSRNVTVGNPPSQPVPTEVQ